MKKITDYILCVGITAIIVAGVSLWFSSNKMKSFQNNQTTLAVQQVQQSVLKELINYSNTLQKQLTALATLLADNTEFTMKLLVEQDYSASEIADVAQLYMKPMGLSFLEITDSTYTVLSSGHLPASAGSIASLKKKMSNGTLFCLTENIKGNEQLSLQLKIPFTVGGKTLYCIGGTRLDSAFIASLNHYDPVRIVLKSNTEIEDGADIFKQIPEIQNNSVTINNIRYISRSFPLKTLNEGAAPQILLLAPVH
ncbi:MAG: hypothetical protein JW795_05385 [Chitinivibrionales bacterium]|nr:hypothetical protein [Chitinivibrionales bacterium]